MSMPTVGLTETSAHRVSTYSDVMISIGLGLTQPPENEIHASDYSWLIHSQCVSHVVIKTLIIVAHITSISNIVKHDS